MNVNILKTSSLAALIALTLACGYGSKNYAPVAGTMPAISQLNPDNATAGGNGFTMTVNGSNFASKAVVNWNGTAQSSTTTFVSGNQLTVAIPSGMIAASGTVQITVTNPATPGTGMYGSGGTLAETSAPMTFTIN
ncbi:MAG TPA: hypothetical protein VJP87_08175 [Candidatus Acidoferrales bacterium]|nr:hypothetical protein [Candidatus Acidoferrales bacterium]